MKKIFLLFALMISSLAAFAQNDILNKHDGTTVECNVIRVNEFTIIYKYVNEDAEQTISKYAVGTIKYGKSGRVEEISPKIEINGASDWNKVIVVEDKALISGLKRVDEVRGKTSIFNMRTDNGNDKKAIEKMKQAAAAMGCPFVLFVSGNKAVGASSGNTLGGTQAAKNGVGYKY
ncbi:MAG: hypothetical protein PHD21_01690 [Flavobacteriales bacterium]|nr:hypothetical protein [Flavobacteriales bacterium]